MKWFKKKTQSEIPRKLYTIQDQVADLVSELLARPDDWRINRYSNNNLIHESGVNVYIHEPLFKDIPRRAEIWSGDSSRDNNVKFEGEKAENILRLADRVVRYHKPFEQLTPEEKILATVGKWTTPDLYLAEEIKTLL